MHFVWERQFELEYAVGERAEGEMRFFRKRLLLMHFAHACGIKQVKVLAVPVGFHNHQPLSSHRFCWIRILGCGMLLAEKGEKKKKKNSMTQVSSEPICMTIKNSISNTRRRFARAVLKHRLSTAAWQHGNMAGMQDDKAVVETVGCH